MKRKFKLFATVASLCLSVALMAFGVYAATSVSYSVNGTVSYNMQDVLVTVTMQTEYVTDMHEGHAEGDVTELTYENRQQVDSYTSYNAGTNLPEGNGTHSADANIDLNTSSAWKITITVATINPTGVEVAIDDDTFGLTGSENFAVVAGAENKYDTQIANDGSSQFVYYVYLKDATVAISQANFSVDLNITQYAA